MNLPTLSKEELTKIAERLTPIACAQRDDSIRFKQPKLEKILKAEELYFNIVTRTLKGRFNIPLPIVSGFVDTLLSKVDDEIEINYDETETADKIRCRKYAACWKYDSAPTRGMWAIKDLLTKKLAIFSGVGINKIYSESDPTYKNNLYIVDAFDFHCEATGGFNLEDHLFCGVDGIYRTKHQVEKASHYDKEQVAKLATAVSDEKYKAAMEIYKNRMNRFKTLGLDVESSNYVGVSMFGFCEWNMYDTVTGRRFYLLFDPNARIWVRIAPLEEITGKPDDFELPKYMFKAWHTHPDAWNFWSKAPVDDVIPVATVLKTLVNFMFDEVQKGLWGQRLYDPEIITDPSQLEWDRPDKLIMATVPSGKKISDGVWQFPTGDKSHITVNMLDYFRNFVAVESGVTPQSKGDSDEKLLGIAKINEGEVADRLGLTNKWYRQFYAELGDAFLRGAQMCIDEKKLIKMIGEQGTESTEISSEDKNFVSMPSVRITGGKTEARKSQELQEARSASLIKVVELYPDKLNPKIAIEHLLANGFWKIDEITPLLDVAIEGDEDEAVYASQAIQDIIEGQTPKVYRGATTRFMQKIIDFAVKRQTDDAITEKLMAYALKHQQFAVENLAREAMLKNLAALANAPQDPNNPNPEQPAQPNQQQIAAPA